MPCPELQRDIVVAVLFVDVDLAFVPIHMEIILLTTKSHDHERLAYEGPTGHATDVNSWWSHQGVSPHSRVAILGSLLNHGWTLYRSRRGHWQAVRPIVPVLQHFYLVVVDGIASTRIIYGQKRDSDP